MPETEYSQQNIGAIRTRLDNLERMMRLSIASNPNSQEYIEAIFRKRKGSAEVYLALADGPRSQEQLIQAVGKSQATVSKICGYLFEGGVIEKVSSSGSERLLWSWHEMERALGISRVARRLVGS